MSFAAPSPPRYSVERVGVRGDRVPGKADVVPARRQVPLTPTWADENQLPSSAQFCCASSTPTESHSKAQGRERSERTLGKIRRQREPQRGSTERMSAMQGATRLWNSYGVLPVAPSPTQGALAPLATLG